MTNTFCRCAFPLQRPVSCLFDSWHCQVTNPVTSLSTCTDMSGDQSVLYLYMLWHIPTTSPQSMCNPILVISRSFVCTSYNIGRGEMIKRKLINYQPNYPKFWSSNHNVFNLNIRGMFKVIFLKTITVWVFTLEYSPMPNSDTIRFFSKFWKLYLTRKYHRKYNRRLKTSLPFMILKSQGTKWQ